MSSYEWEGGEIHIPAKQWAKFRTDLLRTWNGRQLANWQLAKEAHKAAKAAAKGKRGEKRINAILPRLAQSAGGTINKWGEFEAPMKRNGFWGPPVIDTAAEDRWAMLEQYCLSGWGKARNLSQAQPQKKAFSIKALSKSTSMNFGGAHISFNNEYNVVVWDVSENNKACERAHEWWFAKELFNALRAIKWTRNSGGTIMGNDEYNRENYDTGGGQDYVKQTFVAIG